MTQKEFKSIKNIGYEKLSELELWSKLNAQQKQRVILNNFRQLDSSEFIAEFESFEQPNVELIKDK